MARVAPGGHAPSSPTAAGARQSYFDIGTYTAVASSVEQLAHRVTMGLFGVLFIMTDESSSSLRTFIVSSIIDALQLAHFPFSPGVRFPWKSPTANSFGTLTQFLQLGFYVESANPAAYWTMFALVLTAMALTVANGVFVANSFANSRVRFSWPLKTLRFSARLLTSVLFIPSVSILFTVFKCETQNGEVRHAIDTGMVCWQGGHAVLAAFAALVAALFISMASLIALMFLDRDVRSSDPLAKSTGRIEFAKLLVTSVVDFLFVVLESPQYRWYLIIVCVLSSGFIFGTNIYFLPFYHANANAVAVCTSTIFFWASASMFLAMLFQSRGATLLFFLGLPLVMYSAHSFMRTRINHIEQLAWDDVPNFAAASIKLRLTIAEFLAHERQHSTGTGFLRASMLSVMSVIPHRRPSANPSEDMEDTTTRSSSTLASPGLDVSPTIPDKKLLLEALEHMRHRFDDSTENHVFLSIVYAKVLDDTHKAHRHLQRAEQSNLHLDEKFFIYSLRKQQESSSSRKMDALSLVTFEHHRDEVGRTVLKVHVLQLRFWEELLRPDPRVQQCLDLSEEIYDLINDAHAHFRKMMQLNPSAKTLREYARFHTHTVNNPWEGLKLVSMAEGLENNIRGSQMSLCDQLQRMESAPGVGQHRNVPVEEEFLNSDTNGFVLISAEQRSLGTIRVANEAFCDIFGWDRAAIVGENFNVILPQPFARAHDQYMRTFQRTGRGPFMNKTRTVLAKHKQGHLIQVLLTLRESTKSFVGIIVPCPTQSHYFIVRDDDYAITAATRDLLSILSVSPAALASGRHVVTRLFPDFGDQAYRQQLAKGIEVDMALLRSRIVSSALARSMSSMASLPAIDLPAANRVPFAPAAPTQPPEEPPSPASSTDRASRRTRLSIVVRRHETATVFCKEYTTPTNETVYTLRIKANETAESTRSALEEEVLSTYSVDDGSASIRRESINRLLADEGDPESGRASENALRVLNQRVKKFHSAVSRAMPHSSLVTLRCASLLLLFFVIASLVITGILLDRSEDVLSGRVEDLTDSVQRQSAHMAIYDQVDLLHGDEQDYVDAHNQTTDLLRESIDQMESLHRSLFFHASSSAALDRLYTSSTVQVWQSSGSTALAGLWEAGLDYHANGLTSWSWFTGEGDITASQAQRATRYVRLNGRGPGLGIALFEASQLYRDGWVKQEDTLWVEFVILLVVIAVGTIVFVLSCVIPPVHRLAEAQKATMDLFLQLPHSAVREIHTRTASMVDALRNDGADTGEQPDINAAQRFFTIVESPDAEEPSTSTRRWSVQLRMTSSRRFWMDPLRAMVEDRRWVAWTSAKYAVLAFGLFGYVLFVRFYILANYESLERLNNDVLYTGQRAHILHGIHAHTRQYIVDPSDGRLQNLSQSISQFQLYEDATINGNKTLGVVGVNHKFHDQLTRVAVYEDACVLSDAAVAAECRSFSNGLLARGLHSGASTFIELAESTTKSRATMNATQVFASEEYNLFDDLHRLYLVDLIEASTEHMVEEARAHYDHVTDVAAISSWCLGVAAVAIYLFFYRSQNHRLQGLLQHNRMTPLMIPMDIGAKLDVVQKFFRFSV